MLFALNHKEQLQKQVVKVNQIGPSLVVEDSPLGVLQKRIFLVQSNTPIGPFVRRRKKREEDIVILTAIFASSIIWRQRVSIQSQGSFQELEFTCSIGGLEGILRFKTFAVLSVWVSNWCVLLAG